MLTLFSNRTQSRFNQTNYLELELIWANYLELELIWAKYLELELIWTNYLELELIWANYLELELICPLHGSAVLKGLIKSAPSIF